jgi:hypothetical protein
VGVHREGVEVVAAALTSWQSGGGAGGRGGQEARGMGRGSVLLEKGKDWGGREKRGQRQAVPILNSVRRWGTGRRGGATC